MQEAVYTERDVLDLRSRIDLVPDEERQTFDGCWLIVSFTDGSTEEITIDAFKGSAANPMTDEELAALFRATAEGHLSKGRADEIIDAVLSLESTGDIRGLMKKLRW